MWEDALLELATQNAWGLMLSFLRHRGRGLVRQVVQTVIVVMVVSCPVSCGRSFRDRVVQFHHATGPGRAARQRQHHGTTTHEGPERLAARHPAYSAAIAALVLAFAIALSSAITAEARAIGLVR